MKKLSLEITANQINFSFGHQLYTFFLRTITYFTYMPTTLYTNKTKSSSDNLILETLFALALGKIIEIGGF